MKKPLNIGKWLLGVGLFVLMSIELSACATRGYVRTDARYGYGYPRPYYAPYRIYTPPPPRYYYGHSRGRGRRY